MAPVGGKVKKLQKFFLFQNELKSPKNYMFFSTFGGWVGGSEANVDKYTFF